MEIPGIEDAVGVKKAYQTTIRLPSTRAMYPNTSKKVTPIGTEIRTDRKNLGIRILSDPQFEKSPGSQGS
jgi:hypothetical protein